MSRIRWIAAALALLLSAPSAQAFHQVKVYAAKHDQDMSVVVSDLLKKAGIEAE